MVLLSGCTGASSLCSPCVAVRVFAENGVPIKIDGLAEELRKHLKLAGVTRAKLFERNSRRIAMRAHDLRATFVTVALAADKSETWITDRTGHKSNAMVRRYRRHARKWAEMKTPELLPLCRALPELIAPCNTPILSGPTGT
jgi:hypothetical protein